MFRKWCFRRAARKKLLDAGLADRDVRDLEGYGIGVVSILTLFLIFGPLIVKLVEFLLDQLRSGKEPFDALKNAVAFAQSMKGL